MDEMRMEGGGEIGISISGGKSRIQEKIEVCQQVLTLLEDTMSSAKSTYQLKQTSFQTKIDELQLQIQNLKHEMQRDEEDFKEITSSLENGIQNYLNLENKLLTIEERSHDDYEVFPDLSASTDIYVAQYLPPKCSEWQRLKLQCQVLNHSTQNSFRDNICVKRYQVSVESTCESMQRYLQTMDKANALNLFRGKKYISASPTPPSRFVNLTWYKNEYAASCYVQRNYHKIIEQVFKEHYEEYNGKRIGVTELQNVNEPDVPLFATELTIHVQPKTSSSLNAHCIPRRITLYQFDEAITYTPPNVTTFNIQTAPPADTMDRVNGESETVATSSVYVSPVREKVIMAPTSENKSTNKTKRLRGPKSKRTPQKLLPPTSDVLSLVGLSDSRNSTEFTGEAAPFTVDFVSPPGSSVPPLPEATGAMIEPVNVNEQISAVDGICNSYLTEWAKEYIQTKCIEKLTDVQKQIIESFKLRGDILYEGIANGGKTTGMALGLINCVDPGKDCVQALIVTSNSRSSKLIQKAAAFTGEQHVVLCQRIDQLVLASKEISKSNLSRLKIVNKPTCHILVGTLEEMKVFVMQNRVHKDGVRYLILHKAEEIYGSAGSGKQKDNALSVNQILYALDATVKVIVVRRTMVKCPELDVFCQRKLREKQYLKETIDMSEFLYKKAHSSEETKSASSDSDCVIPLEENNGCDRRTEVIEASTSKSYRTLTPARTSSLEGPGRSDSEESDESESSNWTTFISRKGMQLLGISGNVEKRGTENEPGLLDDTVTHLYANIEKGNESSKIDMISMLNLEEDKAIIFCENCEKAEWVSTRLRQNKLWPQVLHEEVLPKDQRVILQNYRQGSFCRVLICTDFLTSISLDSADVVVNFDLPQSKYIYISRAAFAARHIKNGGSPGRGGDAKGVVVNLSLNEFKELHELERSLGITIYNCED